MITIIQNKDRATFRVINDVAFDEVTVMMQDAEAAEEIGLKSPFASIKNGSLSNGVDDLENFTSEMEWIFFVPVGFSCVFSNWYSYVSTPPAFPLADSWMNSCR